MLSKYYIAESNEKKILLVSETEEKILNTLL